MTNCKGDAMVPVVAVGFFWGGLVYHTTVTESLDTFLSEHEIHWMTH